MPVRAKPGMYSAVRRPTCTKSYVFFDFDHAADWKDSIWQESRLENLVSRFDMEPALWLAQYLFP